MTQSSSAGAEHRAVVGIADAGVLQRYANELQMLSQRYAEDKTKLGLLKSLWQYAAGCVLTNA